LNDPRLNGIQVKGDLIVQKSDRIMTRSRARQNPDQYTTVTAQLKIIKLLVEELLAASGNRPLDPSSAAAADLDDDDEEDDDWEDDPNDFVDLASGMSKSQLMSYAADDGASSSRGRDDDTEAYLLNWFRQTSQKPGFGDMFNALTEEEQEKLRNMNA
jgi:importin-9